MRRTNKVAEYNPKDVRLRKAKVKCNLAAIADLCRNFTLQVHDTYDDDELEFLKAMDRYKSEYQRPYPTWREVLAVLKFLGYSKRATFNRTEQ